MTVECFLITVSISVVVFGWFRFSVSFWFSLVRKKKERGFKSIKLEIKNYNGHHRNTRILRLLQATIFP